MQRWKDELSRRGWTGLTHCCHCARWAINNLQGGGGGLLQSTACILHNHTLPLSLSIENNSQHWMKLGQDVRRKRVLFTHLPRTFVKNSKSGFFMFEKNWFWNVLLIFCRRVKARTCGWMRNNLSRSFQNISHLTAVLTDTQGRPFYPSYSV